MKDPNELGNAMSFPFFTIILLLAKEFASIEELHASQFSNIDLVLLSLTFKVFAP